MGVFKNTENYIETYGEQVTKEIQNRLKSHGKYATGKLYKSIKFELKKNKEDIIILFKMADYGQYVDKGVNGWKKRTGGKYQFKPKDGNGTGGKSKFIQSLFKWCQAKGMDKNAAFAIRRKVWRDGISPTNFFTIPTTRRQKQFEKGVERNMIKDIEIQLQKEFK